MEQGPGCRTRDFFIFTERGNAVEPGPTALSWRLISDTVHRVSCLMEPLMGGGRVCSLDMRPGVVGEGPRTGAPCIVLWQ